MRLANKMYYALPLLSSTNKGPSNATSNKDGCDFYNYYLPHLLQYTLYESHFCHKRQLCAYSKYEQ